MIGFTGKRDWGTGDVVGGVWGIKGVVGGGVRFGFWEVDAVD